MAQLYYSRWDKQFSLFEFSSEDSMRDYIFANPELIFEEDSWVIPIKEEMSLPDSVRPDIVLCRILKDPEEDIELWIVELKNTEADEKGFTQLTNYMEKVQGNAELQNEIIQEIRKKVRKNLKDEGIETEINERASLKVCGCLVAPFFDLSENLVKAVREYQSPVSLIKLMRFKRGDETIIYSENVLGSLGRKRETMNPVELFQEGIIKEDDIFYFRDNNDKIYNNDDNLVQCKVLPKAGPGSSFIIKIEKVIQNGVERNTVPISEDIYSPDGKCTFEDKSINVEITSRQGSIALHKLFGVYNDNELWKNTNLLGDNNFVRASDNKSLYDLREKYRKE